MTRRRCCFDAGLAFFRQVSRLVQYLHTPGGAKSIESVGLFHFFPTVCASISSPPVFIHIGKWTIGFWTFVAAFQILLNSSVAGRAAIWRQPPQRMKL